MRRKLILGVAVLVTSLATTLGVASGTAFAANCTATTNAPNWTNPGWTLEADLTVSNCTQVDKFQELEQSFFYTPDQLHTTGQHAYLQSGPQVNVPGGVWAYVLPQRPCHDFAPLGVGGWVWSAVDGFRIHNSVTHTWGQENFAQRSPQSQLIPSCVG